MTGDEIRRARALSAVVADQVLRDEVRALRDQLAAVTAELDRLRAAAERVDECVEHGMPTGAVWWAALDDLSFALENDELQASMRRHPAGKGGTGA